MNRRDFMKWISVAPWLPAGLPTRLRADTGNFRRLILIELAGANDGLNTLVPYRDDNYHSLRPTLALKARDVVRLDDSHAFHKSLKPILPLWESGRTAVVHGLGYPAPNRSHFLSIKLWNVGQDGQSVARADQGGWLTDAIEAQYPLADIDAHGVSLDARMGVFASRQGAWLNLKSLARIPESRSLVEPPTQPVQDPAMALLMRQQNVLKHSLGRLEGKLDGVNLSTYRRFLPDGHNLQQQMRQVLALIDLDLRIPVYKLSLGSFDTHRSQSGRHSALLDRLATSLAGLVDGLKHSGEWDKTLIMTYSEFGRRARENGSAGTDHGTAAPHILLGGAVAGGFYGQSPSLDALVDDDLVHTMDYRAVYDRVLSDWFGATGHRFTGYRDERLQRIVSV